MPPGKPDQEDTRFAHSKLLDAIPDAVVIVDPDGRVANFNLRAQSLFGYTSHELIGEPMELLLPEALRDRHVAHRAEYLESPHVRPMGVGIDLYARRKDGTELQVEVSLAPFQSPEGPRVVCTVRDVADRRSTQ
jgi:PAS domain S-box-containing protein